MISVCKILKYTSKNPPEKLPLSPVKTETPFLLFPARFTFGFPSGDASFIHLFLKST